MVIRIHASAFCGAAAFLTTTLQVSALQFLDAGVTLHDTNLEGVPKFYMYNDPALTITDGLRNCKETVSEWPAYVDILEPLRSQLKNHTQRVTTARKAEWFIVPFDLDLNEAVGPCNGTTAEERVNAALDALEASPFFKQNQGKDHVMVAMRHRIYPDSAQWDVYLPAKRRALLQNMVIGHYKNHHINLNDKVYGIDMMNTHGHGWLYSGVDWRCTWLLPVQSAEGLWQEDESFEEWNKRPNTIFFRGHSERCSGHGAQDLRKSTHLLTGVVPNIIVNNSHADSFDQYVQEITSSKFCLVMRCDDPQTSRMVDSLAAGCIPVLISEGLGLVAKPFSAQVNYDAFTVTIEESVWMQDTLAAARFAYNWSPHEMRRMHKNLQAARAQLLWNHPQSQVASVALRELSESCGVE